MKQQPFLLAIFMLCQPALCAADDPQLPKDLPPVLGIATATASKESPSAVIIKIVVPAMAAEVRGKIVPKRSWPEAHVTVTPRNISVEIDPKSRSALVGSKVLTVAGKAVLKDELMRKLNKPTAVLISTTGRNTDPYYLQVVKPDTLLVVLGPRDGSPDLSLMPQINSEPSSQNR